jgi:hypothetical protein
MNVWGYGSGPNFQRQILIAGYAACDEAHFPHHPISCGNGLLTLNEDNSMECEHLKVSGESEKTQLALNAAVSIMLMEEAFRILA